MSGKELLKCVCGKEPLMMQIQSPEFHELQWYIACTCGKRTGNYELKSDVVSIWNESVVLDIEYEKARNNSVKTEPSNVRATLEERGKRYGNFETHADISQALKDVAKPYYHRLRPIHRETLDMIFHKIARMLNGDPEYEDNPHDMGGYSTLLEDNIRERKGKL